MDAQKNMKNLIMIIGAGIGAVIGILGALILVKNAETQQKKVSIAPRDGVKLGMTVLGLLREIANLAQSGKGK